MKHSVTLITGGSRSGKSAYALTLLEQAENKAFLATAEAIDDEMQGRIQAHKKERGEEFQTIEEPVKIWEVLKSLSNDIEIIVVDCLTVWLGNLQYHLDDEKKEAEAIESFLSVLSNPPCEVIVVTNELGMGIIPENPLVRRFRDEAGRLNQKVAALADKVVLTVSGIPMVIKDSTRD